MALYAVLLFGLVLLGTAAYSLATGRVRTRSPHRWVSKNDEPGPYWLHVVGYAAAGLFFAGFAGYALWHQ